ncbi:MAG TPA: recombinase family protein [Planctomycetota bacterium]|nr:recombinase family protein [Planctomycetota bacterium]
MNLRWDEALRSLARRGEGPVRTLAYAAIERPEEAAARESELDGLLQAQGFLPAAAPIVELAVSGSGAVSRPRFQEEILERIETVRRPAPAPAPERGAGGGDLGVREARERLRAMSTELDRFLDGLPPDPFSEPPARSLEPAEPRGGTTMKARKGPTETPLVLVDRFEDLGSDAEAISAAVLAIVIRGAHLVLPSEGIDTRVREGRGRVALAIRLGGIKAVRARERSLRDVEERRRGLEVYGPIPFGFERRGQKLVPLPGPMETVTRAKDLAGRGLGPVEIAHALNRDGRPWKDGTGWTGRRVVLVLRNPIYRGPLEEQSA